MEQKERDSEEKAAEQKEATKEGRENIMKKWRATECRRRSAETEEAQTWSQDGAEIVQTEQKQ